MPRSAAAQPPDPTRVRSELCISGDDPCLQTTIRLTKLQPVDGREPTCPKVRCRTDPATSYDAPVVRLTGRVVTDETEAGVVLSGKDFGFTLGVGASPQMFSLPRFGAPGTLVACSGGQATQVPVTAGHLRSSADRRVFLQQFYLLGPSHATCLVGSEETGEALVFDPRRDVGAHVGAARVQGLRIRHAVDCQGHKDYLAGLTETGQRAGVSCWGPWRPVWAMTTTRCGTGSSWSWPRSASRCFTQVLHTPGHTPEHLSLVIYDLTRRPASRRLRESGPKQRCTGAGGWGRGRSRTPQVNGASTSRSSGAASCRGATLSGTRVPEQSGFEL